MQISLNLDFTEKFTSAMKNWSVDNSNESTKKDRIEAEKDIEQRLHAANKVTAISIEKFEGRIGLSYVLYLKIGRLKKQAQNQPIKNVAFTSENYLFVPSLNYINNYTSLSWRDENGGSVDLSPSN